MGAIMDWIVRHPTMALGLALLLALGFGTGLPDLHFDSSNRGLMAAGDPAVAFYENVIATFGEDSILSIVVKTEDIFQQDVLDAIQRLTIEGGAIDGVSRVVSLTTVSNLESVEGVLTTDDLVLSVPSDPQELAELRRKALANELLIGEVVSRDGRTSAVHLFLQSFAASEEFEGKVIGEIEALMERETGALGGRAEMYQIGTPYLRREVRSIIRRDLVTLSPLALGSLFLTLFIFLRSPLAMLPAFSGISSVVAALGLMGSLGYGVTTVSSMIPLLLLVVGSTEDVHLIAEYGEALRHGRPKLEAVRAMAIKSGLAILLTTATTFLGFVTLSWNPIPALSQFGVAASCGIAINFLLTILFVPALLRFLPVSKTLAKPEREYLGGLRRFVLRALDHRRRVFAVAALVVAFCLAMIPRIEIDTDYLRFFPEDSKVQRLYRDVSENLVGAMPLMVVVDTHRADGVKDPEVLADLAELEDFLAQRWDKVIGYADYIRKLHREINDGDPAHFVVPDDPDLISQYTLLLDPDDVSRFVDFDFQRSVILIRGEGRGSSQLRDELRRIEDFAHDHLSRDLDVTVTGEALLVYRASDTISRNLISSIAWVMLPIFGTIALLFSSWRAGLLAMIPNLLPIVVNFGAMGLFGIPLSVATFPVAVIALGIAVDDTIHIMTRFSQESKLTSDNREAIDRTLRHELQAALTTSVALVVGFSMLCFGEFASTRQFGFLAATTMAAAWLADLIVTPMLFESTPLIRGWELLRLRIADQVVKQSPLFRGLRASEVKRVALLGKLETFQAGAVLLRQGDEEDYMLVLLSGAARIEASDPATGRTREIGGVAPGDVIGEVAFFTRTRRTASVLATADGEVLRIDAPRMRRVAAIFPRIAARVYANLAELMGSKVERATQQMFG